ncbi:unnamed protein product [Rotaria sp. Silwood2]|nr:unnamed protein product [Rotaria sp. Silwood2]CAF2536570.1 unnamed protein product [Rotaria sp. Silwood2]CAF2788767.1 unnamed protein product [Rotaria sp. Silwood2]CAF2933818.1 unnamed protein product [Rotaria sp. Silwood2]CAF4292794.1 unnamed protein product [Rotaria sp. Silwood2]
MSSNKNKKWSSISSLSKLLSQITHSLLIPSKKSTQTLKKNKKKVKPTESIIKNVDFVAQSVPVTRRHPPQSISKVLQIQNSIKENHYRQIVHENLYVKSEDIDEEDDDYSRYSLQPNLSLFNISTENLNYKSEDYNQERLSRQYDWLDNIFHSTKIEEY